jgi:proteasome lid subunit RPN8/RPN11
MRSRLDPAAAPTLVFTPLAWLKLQYFCHAGGTEIGGFGISDAADLLRVVDFVPIRQRSCPVSVAFDDDAVADFVDACVDAGLPQDQFFRLWIHTHPGSSVEPSGIDEQTFARVFGSSPWAVMFLLGRTGQTLARLSFHAGPGASLLLPVAVDWTDWARVVQDPAFCLSTLVAQWQAEFAATIKPAIPFLLERPAASWYATGPWDDVEALYFEERDYGEPFHEFDPWA